MMALVTHLNDVEHLHQMSARIEAWTSRMKNKGQQAFVHSKMEAVQNCAMVKEKILESQATSKRVMKKGTKKHAELRGQREQRKKEMKEEQRHRLL
jgi:hypothetical protein